MGWGSAVSQAARLNPALSLGVSRLGLTPWRPGFAPRPVNVGFAVDLVALEQVFLRIFLFSAVNITPPWLHLGTNSRLDGGCCRLIDTNMKKQTGV
jgi:hypothetical protein